MMTHHDLFFLRAIVAVPKPGSYATSTLAWYHPTHFPSRLLRRSPLVLVPLSVMSGHMWRCLSPPSFWHCVEYACHLRNSPRFLFFCLLRPCYGVVNANFYYGNLLRTIASCFWKSPRLSI